MEGSVAADGGYTPPTVLADAMKKSPEGGAETNSNINCSLNGFNNGERPKRKMKTPYQLQVLEETFAVENYPSETLRAEVSAKIGLSDRQLQMWFCHRRLKERKPSPSAKRPIVEEKSTPICLPALPVKHMVSTVESSSSRKPYPGGRQGTGRPGLVSTSSLGADVGIGNMYYEHTGMKLMGRPQLSAVEKRVVASVEAQLGEPLREDGPILGVVFEPLPPGAFGAPIVVTPHQKQPMRPYSAIIYEKHDAVTTSNSVSGRENYYIPSSSSGKRKSLPFGNTHAVTPRTVTPRTVTPHTFTPVTVSPHASSRDVHEYQFLPEQPSIKSELHERPSQTHLFDPSVMTPNTCFPYLHGNEQVSPVYNFQVQPQHPSILSNQRKVSKDPVTNNVADAQFGVHQVLGSENMHLPSDKRGFEDEDISRVEKRRKTEEARIQKEVEAHEKRIRKELEKQDILRKKREEHMRREMEKLDRDRKKEEERILREKQREEERFLREQRRENERREKILQKESRRVEKMRQKEALRKEKEAARLKAASERATARKLAKEYTELIEDERIELMELAAASKGLNSITSLDSETLEQLDMFRGMLGDFPPNSIKLKRPFATLPWTKSEENVANLLMVWKFLITFIDVFGLTAFSIDEFVQALHDYDSKLLGDIHVTLLKSIIKDIEDVARTPSTAFGVNQNSAANPGGGHPQIVEGAYAWGFDIRSWQRHLNILTWPEILRQFALSAGFGPRLKKETAERLFSHDDNEGYNGEDVITRLRNGTAAENAVALMNERGYSNRRRSRHRLTPGTVKFAAFHVLSLEGSRGLTILEVADKIQKSGLRDLRTSKTPEASIAAALSRDTKLFERTAPSTYCVKSPFRKDPIDADTILNTAREKVQAFQNGLSDSEGAEKELEDADDAEREDDSECDDPEVDVILNKSGVSLNVLKSTENETPIIADKITGKSNMSADDIISNSKAPIDVDVDVEDTKFNEVNCGEVWVQGLTEGEYSNLSVEERLNALVALIGVAIEGNSIHMILEERLEAANTLKKQLWADAQMDKRRGKDEYMCKVQYSSYVGSTHDASQNEDGSGNQVPVSSDQILDLQRQNNISAERSLLAQEPLSINQDSVAVQQQGYALEKSQLKSFISHKAEQLYVYRSLPLGQDRRHNRYWLFSTSSSPNETSSGRIFFESKDGTWKLIDSEESFDALLTVLDTRGKRESHLHSMLERIGPTFKEAIRRSKKPVNQSNSNLSTLDSHREFDNPSMILESEESSAYFKIETGSNEKERNTISRRYKMLLTWTWKECYSASVLCAMKYGKRRRTELLQACHLCYHCYFAEEKHCPLCHRTFKPSDNFDASYSEHVAHCEVNPDWIVPMPVGFGSQLIKAQLSLIEAFIPAEAFQPFWTDKRKSWGSKLRSSVYTKELLQLIAELESAINRDWLSPNYETMQEWLELSTSGSVNEKNAACHGSIPQIPWFPDTIATVGLRLLDFDASISYVPERKLEFKGVESSNIINPQSRPSSIKSTEDPENIRSLEPLNYQKELKLVDSNSGGRRGRGRGARDRGVSRGRGRGGRGIRGNNIISGDGSYERATRKYRARGSGSSGGRPRGRGRGRGRRPRGLLQRPQLQMPVPKAQQLHDFSNVNEESPVSSGDNEWALQPRNTYVENDNEDDRSGSPQYDDNGLMLGYEYDDHSNVNDYIGNYSDRQIEPVDVDDDSEEEEEEVDGEYDGRRTMIMDEDDDDEDDVGRMNMGGYVNGNEEDDEASSSEYSS